MINLNFDSFEIHDYIKIIFYYKLKTMKDKKILTEYLKKKT